MAWDGTTWNRAMVEGLQEAGHTLIPLYRSESFNKYTFATRAFIRALWTPFDVLLADFATFGYLGAKICKLLKKPLVVYARGGDVDTKDPNFVANVNENWVKYALRNAEVILAVSNYLVERILELCPESKEKVRLVHNGVDLEKFSPIKSKLNFRLLDVGNILIYKKGLDTLIEALPKVVARYPQTQLTHIGRDPQGKKEELLALAENLRVSDHVVFRGLVSDEELVCAYQTSDIFVHPARQEQFGVVLLEAMACGLPVVAGDAGGIPEVVPEDDSLVPVNNPDALAEKIMDLFALSDKERWRIGERNRARVQSIFTSTRQVNGVLRALEEAIQRYKGFRCSKSSQVMETSRKTILRRKIGEGSFIGLKRVYNTPEELVQWLKHLYAYRYAKRFAEGKSVLDIGCGTGYGIHELSAEASDAIGIDIWKEGIYYCHQEYGKKSSFLIASGLNLPFRDNTFDLAVSFQVMEHIDPDIVINYLEEMKRSLKNNGRFIVSTPNRRLRLLPFQKPWNPDHKKEYDGQELQNILKRVFEKVDVSGLFARKDAYLVENNRVKQSPFLVYPFLIVKHILPSYFIGTLKRFVTKRREIKQKTKRFKNMTHNLSLKDFQTSRQNLEVCIDLYGVCIKKPSETRG